LVRIVFSPRALLDLERLTDFLVESDKNAALATLEIIESAIQILSEHPYIGRTCDAHIRELIISRGKSGYVALYSFDEAKNAVIICTIRHQKESGITP
jgi:plasmid stabilization system protein ParE